MACVFFKNLLSDRLDDNNIKKKRMTTEQQNAAEFIKF